MTSRLQDGVSREGVVVILRLSDRRHRHCLRPPLNRMPSVAFLYLKHPVWFRVRRIDRQRGNGENWVESRMAVFGLLDVQSGRRF
jgi:hypothetical protein